MNRYLKALFGLAIALLVGSIPVSAQVGGLPVPSYRLVVPDPQISRINNLGQGIGNLVTASGVTHAFIETNGRRTDLGSLGGWSHAGAINDLGQVAGTSLGADGRIHLFLYSGGVMRDLGVLGENANVLGVNSRGEIIGNHAPAGRNRPPGRENVAFLYSGGRLRELVPLDRYYEAFARAINDRGQVVGFAADEEAVIWEGGRTRVIGPLIGSWSFPEDINDRGDVVGSGALPGSAGPGDGRAFLYSGGRVTDLGTFGGPLAYANAINNLGQIVGGAEIRYHETRAFIYERGRMHNLNDLIQPGTGWFLEAGTAINDRGEILAWGYRGGEARIVRLVPVPAR